MSGTYNSQEDIHLDFKNIEYGKKKKILSMYLSLIKIKNWWVKLDSKVYSAVMSFYYYGNFLCIFCLMNQVIMAAYDSL